MRRKLPWLPVTKPQPFRRIGSDLSQTNGNSTGWKMARWLDIIKVWWNQWKNNKERWYKYLNFDFKNDDPWLNMVKWRKMMIKHWMLEWLNPEKNHRSGVRCEQLMLDKFPNWTRSEVWMGLVVSGANKPQKAVAASHPPDTSCHELGSRKRRYEP